MKICPVCESTLFDDMDMCFGCLYRFGSDPALEAARSMRCAMNHPSSKRSDRIKDTTSPALWRGVSDGLCEFRAHGTKYEKVNF